MTPIDGQGNVNGAETERLIPPCGMRELGVQNAEAMANK